MASPSTTITIRVPVSLKKKLDRMAKDWGRSRSEIGTEAIENLVEWNEYAIKRINEGIAAADRGEFVSDEEVEATFARLRKKYSAR